MNIKPKLEQFLKEKGVLDAFIKNVGERYARYSQTLEWVTAYDIEGAFPWSETKEGIEFWRGLSNEFEGVRPTYCPVKKERKFEEITIPAIAVETKCFGAETIEVRMKVDLEEFFKKFSYSDIREFFEEQIEDEILEERNKAYEEGYEKGKEFYSDYADYVAHKRDIIESRY